MKSQLLTISVLCRNNVHIDGGRGGIIKITIHKIYLEMYNICTYQTNLIGLFLIRKTNIIICFLLFFHEVLRLIGGEGGFLDICSEIMFLKYS